MKRILSALLIFGLLCPVCRAAEAPAVSAASVVLMDGDSGRVLYEKDSHTRRLIASTTKLMTALVAVESTPDLELCIKMKPEYQAEGSSMYLKLGEELTLRELLYGLLLASGNDAALAIAGGCAGDIDTFVAWMNQRAQGLGMKDTHFENPNGLDGDTHYSTAYDMALLARAVLENEILCEIVSTKSITVAGRNLTNHNKLLWRYDGCVGMKTGYTDAAGRTLVSCAQRDGQTLICITLKDPNDWDDHQALFDYGFETWSNYQLAREKKVVRTLPVTRSLLSQVDIVMGNDVWYPLTQQEQVKALYTLPVCVTAPLTQGQLAGRLTFCLGDEVIGECYLFFGADIPDNTSNPSLFGRVSDFLVGREANCGLSRLLSVR